MTSPIPTRLYVVASTDTGAERLIRAENKHKAVLQATVARIATQTDLERLFALGVIPEAPEGLLPLDEVAVTKRGRPKSETNGAPMKRRTTTPARSHRHV